MEDDPPVRQLSEIATSSVSVRHRARELLETLGGCVASEGMWLAVCDPRSSVYATLGSTGLDQPVVDFLGRPSVGREIRLAGINRPQPPVSLADLPMAADELPTWSDCLIPAGFREGLGVPLFEPGGPYLGLLTVLFGSADPPSATTRDRLARLAPLVARGVSPLRSLLSIAQFVQGARAGMILNGDGTSDRLAGFDDHPLLHPASPVVDIARDALHSGHAYRSFLWPVHDGSGSCSHLRATVLVATNAPAFVQGILLITPDADCQGLTPRELQVLGLLVDGWSNQQIGTRLEVAPRTVAAHMEHVLHKLDASSRTLAAVRAERDGCYVPPRPSSSRRQSRNEPSPSGT